MNVLDQERIIVTHLMDVCKDGRDFYRSAAEKVENEELEKLFRENADTREDIIVNLQDYMKQQGESIEVEGTVAGKTIQFFGEMVAAVSPNTDETFLIQLEEAEDRALEEFHKAGATNITLELKERIMRYVKDLKHTHGRISVS